MHTALLIARKLAARSLTVFDPPRYVQQQASYATSGSLTVPVTGHAGRRDQLPV